MDSPKLRHQKPGHENLFDIHVHYIIYIFIDTDYVSYSFFPLLVALRLSVNGDLYVDRIAEGYRPQ